MKYNKALIDNYELTAGGGTISIDTTAYNEVVRLYGTATLSSSLTVQALSTPVKNTVVQINYVARLTIGSNTVTIFGKQLTAQEAMQDNIIICLYNGSAWEVFLVSSKSNLPRITVGINTITLTSAGGTKVLDPLVDSDVQIIVGNATLSSSYTLSGITSPAPDGRTSFVIMYDATMTLNGNDITLFGTALTPPQGLRGNIIVVAYYDNSTSAWISRLLNGNVDELWEKGTGTDTVVQITTAGQVDTSGDTNVITGVQHTVEGDRNLVSGDTNDVSGDDNIVSGNSNVVSGDRNTISGKDHTIESSDCVVGGFTNVIEAGCDQSAAFGTTNYIQKARSIAKNGQNNSTRAVDSEVGGQYGVSFWVGSSVLGGGQHLAQRGSSQSGIIMLLRTTTDATATPMNALIGDTGQDGGILIPDDSMGYFEISVAAVQSAGSAGTLGDSFGQKIKGVYKNIAGTLTIVDSVVPETPINDTAFGGSVAVTAGAGGLLLVTVTGEADKTISWTAKAEITMVGFSNFGTV